MSEDARAERDIADVVADVGRSRWWLIGFGVLSMIAGLAALAWPGVTVMVLAILFAVQLFALGIFRVVAAFAIPDTSATAKMLSVVLGALSFIVGVVCLRSPLQTVVVLTLVLGAFWLIHGVADIADGVSGRGQPGRVWTIVSGVIALIGGIVVLSSPVASAVTLAWLLGILLLLQGIIAIVAAVGRTRSLETAPTSPATPMASAGSMQATPDAARHAAG